MAPADVNRRTIHDRLAEARAGLRRLEPAEAWAAAQEGAVIVDIRSQDQRDAEGVVPGSEHCPRTVLEWRADPESGHSNPRVARLDAHLILLCAEGYSSSLAAAALQDLGLARATDVVGGFEAWKAAGLPVERAG
jgi:rhodanese-related sulfurtransferase